MINKVAQRIRESKKIVFFTGAGISTESNIPDFRSEGIQENCLKEFGYEPETILSRSFFYNHPEIFYAYFKKKIIKADAIPNKGHIGIKTIEDMNHDVTVITQNIDGLHQKAKSNNVIELHGTVQKNHCIKCYHQYTLNEALTLPEHRCKICNGYIRPEVVLYEEQLDKNSINQAVLAIKESDMLFVLGTSLVVQPAASLIEYFSKDNIVFINKSKTPYDNIATYKFNDSIGKVMTQIIKAVEGI